MIYDRIKQGVFHERPNRFIAIVEIDGKLEKCHVKNTGRCKELLIPGVTVYLQEASNPNRKTKYDLISVKKGSRIINMDSQIPNKVVYDWIVEGNYFEEVSHIQREKTYGNSRFDIYLETPKKKVFIEVKGVTLEEDDIAMFPDAPTTRGIKHIKELTKSIEEGYEAYVIFVIQMDGIIKFKPNDKTHPEFGQALREARRQGLNILAYDCSIEPDRIKMKSEVAVEL
jgi:sugar fermentation stimulation protein